MSEIFVAPDYTSDAPADWKPAGKADGVVFLGQLSGPGGQIAKPSRLREAMRVLRPVNVLVRVERAARMGSDGNSVLGISQPKSDQIVLLPGFNAFRDEIQKASLESGQPLVCFLTWLEASPELCGAINPLQGPPHSAPHCQRWRCLGKPPGMEGVWALSYCV